MASSAAFDTNDDLGNWVLVGTFSGHGLRAWSDGGADVDWWWEPVLGTVVTDPGASKGSVIPDGGTDELLAAAPEGAQGTGRCWVKSATAVTGRISAFWGRAS